ncbi:MAG: hypothetical protein LCI00_02205 [Chloroflexi bacterium]|nr:hypothetical protein [Chloroflexota bacterium]
MSDFDKFSIIMAGAALVVSIVGTAISIWYTRRSFHISTIPVVGIWINHYTQKSDLRVSENSNQNFKTITSVLSTVMTVNVENFSESIAILDVDMRVDFILSDTAFKEKTQLFFSEHSRSISPKSTSSSTKYDGRKVGGMGEPIYDSIEEYLAKPNLGILELVEPDNPLFMRYRVLYKKPFNMRIKVSYKPALSGAKVHTTTKEFSITLKSSDYQQTLVDLSILEI